MRASARAPRTQTTLATPTVGVEEEFFLLDPGGAAAPVAPQVLAGLPRGPQFQPEWMNFQIESATGICTDLSTLGDELSAGREAVARAAAERGAHMVSSGTPPFGVPGVSALTDDDRFRRMNARFPTSADVVSCGCHVHVGVPTRSLGVQVLNRVRGWLPVLLALSGNSPMWAGEDSGWESYRHILFGRWPTARVAPWCTDAAAYDAALAEQVSTDQALDAKGVYWFARLSPSYPTVEFRVADTGLAVSDTLLQAALCRALVTTALADNDTGRQVVTVPGPVLDESLMNAARHGLGTLLVDPETGVLAPGFTVLYQLVEHLHPALRAAGDWETVAELLTVRRAQRSGAARQRELRQRLDRKAFVAALAAASLPHSVTAGT